MELRQAIEIHIAYQCLPQLGLLEKPVGATNWEPIPEGEIPERDLSGD